MNAKQIVSKLAADHADYLADRNSSTIELMKSLQFKYFETHGGIHADYLCDDGRGRYKPEGFCILANGAVGFCDHWGSTYIAPESFQPK